MNKTDKIETTFDDERFRIAFAHNYHLDPDKDLELMKEIRSIITVKHVYEAKRDTVESVVEYFNKIKDFVTSERSSILWMKQESVFLSIMRSRF